MVEKLKIEGLEEKLAELAKILNSFKSEAVQLRILDYVLREGFPSTQQRPPAVDLGRKKTPRRSKTSKDTSEPAETTGKKKPKAGSGAQSVLSNLLANGFFDEPRTINEIVEYCKRNLALTFKPNEFSGKIIRLVRSGKLTRDQNDDNQYEYKKP